MPLLRDALLLQQKTLGDQNAATAKTKRNLGYVLFRNDEFAESEVMLQEALSTQLCLFSPEHRDVLETSFDLGYLSTFMGKSTEAECIFRSCLTSGRKALGEGDPHVLPYFRNLFRLLLKQDRGAEAELLLADFTEAWAQLPPGGRSELGVQIASLLVETERHADAESFFWEGVKDYGNLSPKGKVDVFSGLIVSLVMQRKFGEAEDFLNKTLVKSQSKEKVYAQAASSLRATGEAMYRRGDHAAAEPLLRWTCKMSRMNSSIDPDKVLGCDRQIM